MNSMDQFIQKNPDIAYRVIDENALIVKTDDEDNKLLILNPVATAIWELANGENTVKTISERIWEKFEVGKAKAQKDTLSFIQELLNRELLKLKPDKGA